MTVKELRDALDRYISKDPPGIWQLNDVEADAAAYDARCKERESHEVIILDDGMQPKHFSILSAFGTTLYIENGAKYKEHDVFAICTDLTNSLK